jgi:hypothetical protein
VEAVLAVFRKLGFDDACEIGEILPATEGVKLVLH